MDKSRGVIETEKDAAELTANYASGWSYDIDVRQASFVCLLFAYTYSSATSLEILLARSDADGGTYYDDQRESAVVGTWEDDEQTFAPGASKNFSLLVDVSDTSYLRVQAKRTGGAAADTLACKAVGGNR